MITSTLLMYRDAAVKATTQLGRNWIIIPGVLILYFILQGSTALFGAIPVLGGFLITIIGLALLTLYYSWLDEAVNRRGLAKEDLVHFDSGLFLALISVSFLIWIVEYMVSILIQGMNAGWVMMFLHLAIVFVFNPLAEVVYLRRFESVQAFRESFEFVRDHAIEWFLPFLIVLSPLLLSGVVALPLILATTFPLIPVSALFAVPSAVLPAELGFLSAVLGLLLANWFMLFRAFLFLDLGTGSRRQREFKAKMK